MWHVYIIECADGKFYTGATSNLNQRYLNHKYGKGGKFTKDRKVIALRYCELRPTQKEALEREKQIKGWRREKKLNLIKFGKPII
jgi:predicted GIY-YIG superfamily endonuclease